MKIGRTEKLWLAAVFFFWIAGKEYVEHAVSEGMKEPIGSWFYPLGKYVYCSCAAIALVAGILLVRKRRREQ